MNLHAIAGPIVSTVNPSLYVKIQRSTGYATAADGSRTPAYAQPVTVLAQVQPESWRDIQQMDGLNLQGQRRVMYINGYTDGLVRCTAKGGDLVTLPDGSIWLVAQTLEDFALTAGWTKAALTLQNDAPYDGDSM